MNIITKDSINKTVTIKKGVEVVRSDKLALIFERTHKQVLALIRENLDFFKENNLSLKDYFIEDIGKTSKGREYTRYYLTRKGFDLVALSLRGSKAKLYKIFYIDAFHEKQRVLEENKLICKTNSKDNLWIEFRDEGKEFRNKLTDTIKKYVVDYRYEVEKKMNNGRYYYHYTNLIYSILNITLPAGVNPRDVLDKRMLVRLEDLEDKIADMIKTNSNNGIHYKDSYQQIKKELLGE